MARSVIGDLLGDVFGGAELRLAKIDDVDPDPGLYPGFDASLRAAFRKETLLVNTKAAYLWTAARPGSYATMLARHVRDRARLEGMGFSPGVFTATGKAMPGYADVNTNGIVLAAIAFILRGRRQRGG